MIRAGRVCGIFAAVLLFTQAVFAETSDELSLVLASHKNARPYTMEYIRLTDELFSQVALYEKSDNNEYKNSAKNTESYLDAAIARVDFLMEDTIRRMGSELSIDTKNAEYVSETLVDIADIYNMPAFKSQSPCNDVAYTALSNRVSRLQKFKKEIDSANDVLNDINGDVNLDNALLTYQKLKAERDLLDSTGIEALSNALAVAGKTVVTLPKAVLSANGLNLFGKDGALTEKINLQYTEVKNILPVKVSKQLLNGYTVKSAFKLTVNDVGGEIPVTTFVMPIPDSNGQQVLVNSDGRIFEDTNADPKTFSFKTDKLGDYYLVEYADFYTYSTDFESRLEWQYQNAMMAKLIYMADNTGGGEVALNAMGMREIPRSVLDQLANSGKAIVLKTDTEATLLSAAFKAMDSKEYYPVEMLLSYAKATQDKPEYKQAYIPDSEDDINDEQAGQNVEDPAIIKALALAGFVVTLACLAVIIGNDAKKKL